jgi:hypothetical protein
MNPKKKIWQSNETPQAPATKGKPSKAELELVLKKTQELTQKNPEKAAIILSTWITKERAAKKGTKAA